jgi:uncharacterized membrane protein YeaQ/YmgE (transglycosylase-associated protein family)
MTGRKEAFRSVQLLFPTQANRKSQRGFTNEGAAQMPEAEIGWIAAIIVGGLAGWLAEMFMKSGTGILMNIVLGIVGAALANWLLGLLGVALSGWLGYLITGFVGACIIIALWRAIRSRQAV